jgi:DNA replication protein DnaC
MENIKNCLYFNNCNIHSHCNEDVCIKKYKLDCLYELANLPCKQKNPIVLYLDKDGSDKNAYIRLREIQNNINDFINKGCNLYIYSKNCGNGKTSWAIKLIQSYFINNWPTLSITSNTSALFISVPRFLQLSKENIKNDNAEFQYINNNVLNANLVVFDDIGTKEGTDFEKSYLYSYIDTRLNRGKSNIFTSNLSKEELENFLGERLCSRIYNSSECIELIGSDKRNISI